MKPDTLSAAQMPSLAYLLPMLECLRPDPSGAELLAQVERAGTARQAMCGLIEHAYLVFLHNILHKYSLLRSTDSVSRLKATAIDRRLSRLPAEPPGGDGGLPWPATPDGPRDAAALEQHLVALLWAASGQVPAGETTNADPLAVSHRPVGAPGEIRRLQETLARKLAEAITHSTDYVAHLRTVQLALQRASGPGELADYGAILLEATGELMGGHKALQEALREGHECLETLRSRAEPPGAIPSAPPSAPDRPVLLQRLDVEIRRAQRLRSPLSLAILDPGHVADMDVLVGPNAGQQVIRSYTQRVVSCARAYDVVARCGTHELAWMLPHTKTDQALRALNKLQQQFDALHYRHGGRQRPLPGFSGAVAQCAPGDTAASLLARAEKLAAKAKTAGPPLIETDAPAPSA